MIVCIDIFSRGLPVAQINQEFRFSISLSKQSSKQEIPLLSCVLFFTVPKHCDVSSGLVPRNTDSRDAVNTHVITRSSLKCHRAQRAFLSILCFC